MVFRASPPVHRDVGHGQKHAARQRGWQDRTSSRNRPPTPTTPARMRGSRGGSAAPSPARRDGGRRAPTAPEGAPNIIVMIVDDLGLQRHRVLRLRDRHAEPRLALRHRPAVHQLPLHTDVLTHSGRPAHRLERTRRRRGQRASQRFGLPRLRDGAGRERGHGRRDCFATTGSRPWPSASGTSPRTPSRTRRATSGRGRASAGSSATTECSTPSPTCTIPHRIVEDNHQVEVDQYPDDYYFTDDITDQRHLDDPRDEGGRPVQAVLPVLRPRGGARPAARQARRHGQVPGPLRGRVGCAPRRAVRPPAASSASIEPDVELAPRNAEPGNDVRAWDELSPTEQKLFARHMEVFAGMVDNIDQNLGRLLDALDEMGELDNTLFLFLSDNGASREGEEVGHHRLLRAPAAGRRHRGRPGPDRPHRWAADHPPLPARLGDGRQHPFRLYKLNTHAGGHSVPFLVSLARGHVATRPTALRRQYIHVTDLLPTLLDVTGVERPDASQRSRAQAARRHQLRADAPRRVARPARHVEQHYEMTGPPRATTATAGRW